MPRINGKKIHKHHGWLLPDIVLLTQGYHDRGTLHCSVVIETLSLQPMKEFVITTMLDVVLRRFCFVFASCLVSLHDD